MKPNYTWTIGFICNAGVRVYSSARVNFESKLAPYFAGQELQLSTSLTIYGRDLPEFRIWARKNGVTAIRHVKDFDDYFAGDHTTVAHAFEHQVSLDNLKDVSLRIQWLMTRCRRLVIFIDISDYCTIDSVRRALRSVLPSLTFRTVYPRGVFKTRGIQVIRIERRRPRVYLFMSAEPMSGKTESTLSLGSAFEASIVHGDEYYQAIACGDVAAQGDLRQRISELQDFMPFDRSLFAQFVAQIPAFERTDDVVFDFLVPTHKHMDIVRFFDELGFFPILCSTASDASKLMPTNDLAAYKQMLRRDVESYEQSLRQSTSWRITAPLRYIGRRLPMLARVGRFCLDRIGHMPSAGRGSPAR